MFVIFHQPNFIKFYFFSFSINSSSLIFNFHQVLLIKNFSDKKRFPLHFAVLKNNLDIVKALIDAHAEVNKQDWDNYSPLHFCGQTGFVEGAQILLTYGAAINIQSRKKETPIMIAVQYDQFNMVKFLIETHADVQKTAIGIFKKKFFFIMFFNLLYFNRSPLFYANIGSIAGILIDSGAAIEHKDDDGMTALHSSAERGKVEVCKVLIEKGAQVNALDSQKVFINFIFLIRLLCTRQSTTIEKKSLSCFWNLALKSRFWIFQDKVLRQLQRQRNFTISSRLFHRLDKKQKKLIKSCKKNKQKKLEKFFFFFFLCFIKNN